MDDSQLLISRVEDLIWDESRGKNSFLGFLNEQEAALVCSYLKNRRSDFTLFGGYDNATRVFLSVSDSEVDKECFPITALYITSKGKRELTHRDYLGSLMGIGVKRECVGDIVVLNTAEAVVFVRDEIVSHVQRELNKVANESVKVSIFDGDTSEFADHTEEVRIIVSSMRVDNVVSALTNKSRSEALNLISGDKVFLNYFIVKKPSHYISCDDIISIRGYGKFRICEQVGITKRERLIVNVLHYI